VARLALEAGASIVNDVSALRRDPDMGSVIAHFGAGVVLMHMQGEPPSMQKRPHYGDVVTEVARFLQERMEAAERAGIATTNIVLDPGIGFGKLLVHNLQLLNRLSELTMLNRPVLVGVSHKAFIGRLLDRPVDERGWGTAAAVALAVERGACILRVHDVAAMTDVVKVAAAIRRTGSYTSQEEHA
jgi:dihydropteroate synthase